MHKYQPLNNTIFSIIIVVIMRTYEFSTNEII